MLSCSWGESYERSSEMHPSGLGPFSQMSEVVRTLAPSHKPTFKSESRTALEILSVEGRSERLSTAMRSAILSGVTCASLVPLAIRPVIRSLIQTWSDRSNLYN